IEMKVAKVAALYGAADVAFAPAAKKAANRLRADGLGDLPVCVAKTHLSLSHDTGLGATPENFTFPVRDLRASTGAGGITALAGARAIGPRRMPVPRRSSPSGKRHTSSQTYRARRSGAPSSASRIFSTWRPSAQRAVWTPGPPSRAAASIPESSASIQRSAAP